MVDGGIVVAICQYGGEFTSGPNGNLIYKGGEAHAVDVTRDMPLESFKDEVSKVFHVGVTDMSLKYFLPNNNRTLITISCDRDLQRMVDFTISAAQVDVFLISRVENRFIFCSFLFIMLLEEPTPCLSLLHIFSLMLVKQEYHNSHWSCH
jgi:zinc finger SWIM domain-containing protein 3